MRALCFAILIAAASLATGCEPQGLRGRFPTTASLELDRVVLYRNGVGYFERRGQVDSHSLRIKVRKDQINDLLKSLTIVDRKTGKAVSVSMPLDPQTWANAALASLSPGNGSLAEVLDSLRGAEVVLATTLGSIEGRIVLVERIEQEPDPTTSGKMRGAGPAPALGSDHKVTLMQDKQLRVVRLSKVQGVTLQDGDLAMQFHRRLDATAGEGMFQQVEVAIRLAGKDAHDLVVSYVVEAPMWKPTYRIVLPEGGKGDALLQAWAVVDNTSGEDWKQVKMSLTAGAPIAFRYDMHTPRNVYREDLSHRVHRKRARVAMGETSYVDDDDEDPNTVTKPANEPAGDLFDGRPYGAKAAATPKPRSAERARKYKSKKRRRKRGGKGTGKRGYYPSDLDAPPPAELPPAFGLDNLKRSTAARAKASQVSGLTSFDLGTRVTVPDSSSTMVAVINELVQGEETFLFKPGGAGIGYETNPYRVVRFKNSTPFVLEPGPISIYAGGSFVGEGISETVGAASSATVPFAVETGIMVQRESKGLPEELKLIKIVRGVIHVQRFYQHKTTWKVQAQTKKNGFTVLIRHTSMGSRYKLKLRPEGTEDLPGAYLIPVAVAAGKLKHQIELVEQTPVRTTLSIWDGRAVKLLQKLLVATTLGAVERAKLEPLVKLRQNIGKIDTTINGLKREKRQYDQRADETRENLYAIEGDKSGAAGKLRRDLQKRLDEFTKAGDKVSLDIAKLNRERLQIKIKLEDGLKNLSVDAPSK